MTHRWALAALVLLLAGCTGPNAPAEARPDEQRPDAFCLAPACDTWFDINEARITWSSSSGVIAETYWQDDWVATQTPALPNGVSYGLEHMPPHLFLMLGDSWMSDHDRLVIPGGRETTLERTQNGINLSLMGVEERLDFTGATTAGENGWPAEFSIQRGGASNRYVGASEHTIPAMPRHFEMVPEQTAEGGTLPESWPGETLHDVAAMGADDPRVSAAINWNRWVVLEGSTRPGSTSVWDLVVVDDSCEAASMRVDAATGLVLDASPTVASRCPALGNPIWVNTLGTLRDNTWPIDWDADTLQAVWSYPDAWDGTSTSAAGLPMGTGGWDLRDRVERGSDLFIRTAYALEPGANGFVALEHECNPALASCLLPSLPPTA